ncbi:hypothetical protein PsorP6_011375 [Peronosclerospora sorghi]|uniref:Uncharacterized protein n=1 Tax=Peronosclerospora sorghi TaxID=230839 RepID=A0ACC0WKQ8_9STRA|nr:hypothetical protein PsorP6_011375 [Peronosclerospora sorghi]
MFDSGLQRAKQRGMKSGSSPRQHKHRESIHWYSGPSWTGMLSSDSTIDRDLPPVELHTNKGSAMAPIPSPTADMMDWKNARNGNMQVPAYLSGESLRFSTIATFETASRSDAVAH